jgi:hypothetical protein
MTNNFNWSWVDAKSSTKKDSSAVTQDTTVVHVFKQSSRGNFSAVEMNSFTSSVAQNLQIIRSNWRTQTYPVLSSLPAGTRDRRWSSNLPEKIDCFSYGLQGTTLFVFNDASSTKADGRYWVSLENRPKTIAEAIEDLHKEISNIAAPEQQQTIIDLNPLWAAIGENYRTGSLSSLDTRVGLNESILRQIELDLYQPSVFTYGYGSPLPFSVANMLNELLSLHGSAYGSDPSSINHDGLPVASHTHTYTAVTPSTSQDAVQGRVGPYDTLANDIQRIRFEILSIKGSTTWNSDPVDPVTSSANGSLKKHMDYIGSGTATSSNPHAITLSDLGADPSFSAIQQYTGMTSEVDDSPFYSSNNFITDGDSLTNAISKLDLQIGTVLESNILRVDYSFDRSAFSETIREQNPITINHNNNKKPIVQVIDVSPGPADDDGQYIAPDTYSNVVYLDNDTFQVWTNAAIVEVIAIY